MYQLFFSLDLRIDPWSCRHQKFIFYLFGREKELSGVQIHSLRIYQKHFALSVSARPREQIRAERRSSREGALAQGISGKGYGLLQNRELILYRFRLR